MAIIIVISRVLIKQTLLIRMELVRQDVKQQLGKPLLMVQILILPNFASLNVAPDNL